MKTLTVVAVSSHYKVPEHVTAIVKTAAALPFPVKKLLLSAQRPDPLPADIEWREFATGVDGQESAVRASRFILIELCQHIDTDHCLLVQWDGFALNPAAWDNRFFDYDYIGAPFAENPLYELLFPRFRHRVGNGGFSLRSKKWLELGATAPKYRGQSEDMFCTQQYVQHWKSHGCKIAPIEVAGRFSMEYPLSRHPQLHIKDAFGFHGFLPDGRPRFYGKFDKMAMFKGSVARVSKRAVARVREMFH